MKKSRRIDKRKIFYIVFVIAWAAFSLVGSQLLVSFLLFFVFGEQISKPFGTFCFYFISYALTLFLVLYAPPRLLKRFSGTFRTNGEELGVNKYPTLVDIGLVPIAYIVYVMLANIITSIMTVFPWYDAEQTQDVGFGAGYLAGSDRFFAMLAIVFIAPLCEEILMRGWVYGKLRSALRGRIGIIVAIILTSLLFAMLHGQWNVAVTVFMLSVVLCGLREITGTIWSGVLLHMLSNGIAFYLVYIAGM